MSEADLADAVEGDDSVLGSGSKLPRLGVEEPIVRRLFKLSERVAALVVEAAMFERVGVDEERRCVSQLLWTQMLILGELTPLAEVLPFSIWVETILEHGVAAEGVSFERVGMEGAEGGGIMRRHGEGQGEEVEPEALRFKQRSGESRHQSKAERSRFFRAAHESVLVPSGEPEPKLLIFLHRSRNLERDKVQTTSSSLVDEHLSCLGLPCSGRGAVQVPEKAPDWVRGCEKSMATVSVHNA